MMNGYDAYNGGYNEKQQQQHQQQQQHGYSHPQQHLDDDAFGPKSAASIVSAFDAFRRWWSPQAEGERAHAAHC